MIFPSQKRIKNFSLALLLSRLFNRNTHRKRNSCSNVCVAMDESFDSSSLKYTRCWLCYVPLTSAGWTATKQKKQSNKKWRSQHEKSKWRRGKRTLCVYIHHSRSVKKQVLEFVQRLSLILHHRDTLGLFSLSLFLLARLDTLYRRSNLMIFIFLLSLLTLRIYFIITF